jgi:predicted nucleotidyltransferase
MKSADEIGNAIKGLASAYDLQIIYAFGSRAAEARDFIAGTIGRLTPGSSDLDIGVTSARRLTVQEKVEIALFFEDLFGVPRTDIVVISEAPIALAFRIVTGELLYAKDPTYEAEYQLYIMRMAADLEPYEKEMTRLTIGA